MREPVLAAMSKPLIDHRGPQFAALAKRIDEGLRPLFGTAQADIVLLGSSGTGGLEAAIASTFSPGDRVLAAPVGVFGRRLIAIAKTYGIEVDTSKPTPEAPSIRKHCAARLRAIAAALQRHPAHA